MMVTARKVGTQTLAHVFLNNKIIKKWAKPCRGRWSAQIPLEFIRNSCRIFGSGSPPPHPTFDRMRTPMGWGGVGWGGVGWSRTPMVQGSNRFTMTYGHSITSHRSRDRAEKGCAPVRTVLRRVAPPCELCLHAKHQRPTALRSIPTSFQR